MDITTPGRWSDLLLQVLKFLHWTCEMSLSFIWASRCSRFERGYDSNVNQMNASAQCRDKGGWLVSIHSEAENAFAVTNLEKQNAWIGFNQIYSGEWNWPDGSDVGFQRWSPGGNAVTFRFHSFHSVTSSLYRNLAKSFFVWENLCFRAQWWRFNGGMRPYLWRIWWLERHLLHEHNAICL